MNKDISEVLKKLIEERFSGKGPEWREARWGDINILCAQDSSNWYYRHGNVVYTQAKQGNHTPHCYDCGSEIEFIAQKNSVWFGEFDGPVGGGEVRTKHIPYCPSCEKKPSETGIIID